MPCSVCLRGVPTGKLEALKTSVERHGVLYRCKVCGSLFEVIAEEPAPVFSPVEELRKHYKVVAEPKTSRTGGGDE